MTLIMHIIDKTINAFYRRSSEIGNYVGSLCSRLT